MSAVDDRLERLLAEMLKDAAPARPPARFLPEVERAVDESLRWPSWFASLRERPMRSGPHVVVGYPAVRTAAIAVATLLLVLATVGAGIAGSNLLAGPSSIVVDPAGGGDATTITEAVAIAGDGDEILVRPGIYVESLVLDKEVTVVGDGPRGAIVWRAPDDGPTRQVDMGRGRPYAVLLDDTGSTLSGLTFEGLRSAIHIDGGAPVLEQLVLDGVGEPHTSPTGRGYFANAIAITGSSRAIVRGNTLTASGPIAAHEGAEPLLEGNRLVDGPSILAFSPGDDMVVRGNDITGSIDRAIGVYGPNHITVEGNLVTDAGGDGISVGAKASAGNDPILRDNTVAGAWIGVDVARGAAPVIDSNTIRGSQTGISAGLGTHDLLVTDNQLHDNVLGIAVSMSAGHFEGNVVQGGTTGIVVANGGQPTFVGNTVAGSEYIGFVTDGRSAPVLTSNRICSLGDPIVVDGEPSSEYAATNGVCEDAATE